MIVLFTDYGFQGPYLGQVQVVLHRLAPRQRVINLMADVPPQNIKAGAYLLPAVTRNFPRGTVFLCVVDPGVGTFKDRPVAIEADGSWFVGPDNGLFDLVARRARKLKCREISWRPLTLSASFHGRDLYAPVCAMLANGRQPPGKLIKWKDKHGWPDDLAEVVYIDRFGNCMTGVRAGELQGTEILKAGRRRVRHARTFAAVGPGQSFWYENSSGLVEIAVNRGRACDELRAAVGSRIGFDRSSDP